jgi:hypothetical protein
LVILIFALVKVVATPVFATESFVVLSIEGQDGSTLTIVVKFRVAASLAATVVEASAAGTASAPFNSSTVTVPAVVPVITPSKET